MSGKMAQGSVCRNVNSLVCNTIPYVYDIFKWISREICQGLKSKCNFNFKSTLSYFLSLTWIFIQFIHISDSTLTFFLCGQIDTRRQVKLSLKAAFKFYAILGSDIGSKRQIQRQRKVRSEGEREGGVSSSILAAFARLGCFPAADGPKRAAKQNNKNAVNTFYSHLSFYRISFTVFLIWYAM